MPELHIVIPAYNEASRIEPTLRSYCSFFGARAIITAVLNGCTDNTDDVVRQLLPEYKNLRLVNIAAPIGKGGAVRVGFMLATEPYVGFTDADESFSPQELARLFDCCISDKVDSVIASRSTLAQGLSRPSLARRISSVGFKLVCRMLFGLGFRDTQCGAKVFRRDTLDRILDDLELADFAFDIDLLFQLTRAGGTVIELPVTWEDKAGSTVDVFKSSRSMLLALLRLRLRRSWFGNIPYLDTLASQSVITVTRRLNLLLLADFDASELQTQWILGFIGQWEARGYRVAVWPRSRLGAPPSVFNRLWLRAGLWFWYVFGTKRDYDAIVEISSTMPYMLPYVSLKPSCILNGAAPTGGQESFAYKRFYSRRNRIEFDGGSSIPECIARVVASAMTSPLYSARLHVQEDAVAVSHFDKPTRRHHEQTLSLPMRK